MLVKYSHKGYDQLRIINADNKATDINVPILG
jgi:hypothetical protein